MSDQRVSKAAVWRSGNKNSTEKKNKLKRNAHFGAFPISKLKPEFRMDRESENLQNEPNFPRAIPRCAIS